MKRFIITASVLLAGLGVASAAGAQAIADPAPYQVAPVSDDTLAAASAMALPDFERDLRALTDENAKLYLGTTGVGARVEMDNWWAQTGAALIVNNILGTPRM